MSFPKIFYWLPINVLIGKLIEYLCCELKLEDLVESLPQFTHIPETFKMAENISNLSMKKTSASFVNVFKTPGVINAGLVYDKNVTEAKNIFKRSGVTVEREIEFEPSMKMLSPENIISSFAIRPGSKVDLHVKDNRVVLVTPHKVRIDAETLKGLEREINTLKTDLTTVMSSMRRDIGSTIKLKGNVEKDFQPLTIELVKNFTKEIQPEALKDIDVVKGKELKKAGLNSVIDVLEAVPATVSDATKERMAIATKYIDNAENLTLEITKEVSGELKRVNVTDKKDLNRLDTKALAKKINLPEKKVKEVLSDISKIR